MKIIYMNTLYSNKTSVLYTYCTYHTTLDQDQSHNTFLIQYARETI